MGWQIRVDQWWAGVLGLPAEAVQSGGLFAVDDIDHVGVMEVPGRAPLVYAPPDVVVVLEGRRVLPDGDVVRAVVGALEGRVTCVLGPTWYGYVTQQDFADRNTAAGVRALTAADIDALAELHRQTPRDQVNESGTDGLPAFGVFDGTQLIAVACVKSWHQMPTIAVLTHPARRGLGLATEAVAAATWAGLQQRSEVQYRAYHANGASLAVARACGFSHYGDITVIECSAS